jgi:hypothetical protein
MARYSDTFSSEVALVQLDPFVEGKVSIFPRIVSHHFSNEAKRIVYQLILECGRFQNELQRGIDSQLAQPCDLVTVFEAE